MTQWIDVERPGYFGRRRDEKIAALNKAHGEGGWCLVWRCGGIDLEFVEACRAFYERSYFEWLRHRPADIDYACSFGECIDNSPTNVLSGFDYSKQEAFSTHIQDIALRNVLAKLNRKFEGSPDKILVIRTIDSSGIRFGPGNVPFFAPSLIEQPSKRPGWAGPLSVEDFWQSNKWLRVRQ